MGPLSAWRAAGRRRTRGSGGDAKFQSSAGGGVAAPRSSSPRPLPLPRRGREALQHHEPPRRPPPTAGTAAQADNSEGKPGRAEPGYAVQCCAEPRRATRRAEGRGLPAAAAARARRGWRGGGRRGPGSRRERGARPSPRARPRGGGARLGVAELRRFALGLTRPERRCCRPERSREPPQSCCPLSSLLVLSKSLRGAAVPAVVRLPGPPALELSVPGRLCQSRARWRTSSTPHSSVSEGCA